MFKNQYIGLNDRCGNKMNEGDKVLVTYGKHYNEPKGITRTGKIVYSKKTASFVVAIDNSAVKVSFWEVVSIEIIKMKN